MPKRLIVCGGLLSLLLWAVPAYADPPVGGCPNPKFHLVTLQQTIAEVQQYIPEVTPEQIAAEFEMADRNDDGLICSQTPINPHSPLPINYIR